MVTLFTVRPYSRFIETKCNSGRNEERIKAPIFLHAISAIEKMQEPRPYLKEGQFRHLKKLFFLKNKPTRFHIKNTRGIGPVKRNKLRFSSVEITCHFLPQSTVSCRSRSRSDRTLVVATNQITLKEISIVSRGGNITDNIIRKVIDVGQEN